MCRAVRLLALAWLAMLSLAATAQVTVRDDRGAMLAFGTPPQRIVSLLPSFTESVCALGACDRLVGTDRFSNWPAIVAKLPKLGGLEDAQIERIVALKPDLVVASNSARVVDRLESLGVRVLVLESRNRADVRRTLAVLAQVLALPGADVRVWARIESELAEAARRVPARLEGRRVYFEIDATPYAAGAGSFIGETLERLGLRNALAAELGPFPRLNPEYVVRLQPDIVVAVARELAAMSSRPGWAALHALRDGQTCALPGERFELLVRPGPRMGQAAFALADCLAALPARAPADR